MLDVLRIFGIDVCVFTTTASMVEERSGEDCGIITPVDVSGISIIEGMAVQVEVKITQVVKYVYTLVISVFTDIEYRHLILPVKS